MREDSIKDKTCFITGASSGIGKACAEIFASLGVNVVLTGRRIALLETLAKEISIKYSVNATSYQLDVRNNNEVIEVFQKLSSQNIKIDILVNNSGLALTTDKFQDASVDNWETMIDTNLKGLLYVTKAALPMMIKANHGHIINIGSVAGHDCYTSGNVYCATKHAVRAISKSLRADLLGTAIRVSEIDPGAVETEFSEVRLNDKKKAKEVYTGFQPLVAKDIAEVVAFCATRPPHVNISEIIVYPQAQASITQIHRTEKAL